MSHSNDLLTPEHFPEWDLSALYTHDQDPALASDWQTVLLDAKAFEAKYKSLFLNETWLAQDLYNAICIYEKITELQGKIYTYVGLRYYKNSSDPCIAKQYQETLERMLDIDAHLIFFTLEVNQIAKEQLALALSEHKDLQRYAPYFHQLRLLIPFQKSEEIEKILADKNLISRQAWIRLFDETLAEQRFIVDGEEKSLAQVTQQMGDINPTQRRKAAVALAEGLAKNSKILTMITNNLAKDKSLEDKIRGFQSPLHARHVANQIEPEVVESLVKSVTQSYEKLSHRYYKIKAKLLNLEVLQYWDRNAPLQLIEDKKYSWLEARQIVLDAYHEFSPEIADIGRQFFDNNWIDVPITHGKTDGAFAHPATPSTHPFILLNFEGTKRDVMTLAHELGHGIHQVLAAKQGYLMADTPLTLAETASVFGEMLVFQSLLQKSQSKAEKQTLLASKIDDMLNTVVRQIAFHQFEVHVHTKRQEGEISSVDLNDMWLSTQREALGDGVFLDPLVGNYWGYISHFIHSPFYVYAYAFADCLVNSLFQFFQQNPDGFVEKYKTMLSAGGTLGHKELLSPFGLDASQPTFWDKGLAVIESLIDELEKLS